MRASSSQGSNAPWAGGTSTLDSTPRQRFGLSQSFLEKSLLFRNPADPCSRSIAPRPKVPRKLRPGWGEWWAAGWGGHRVAFPPLSHPSLTLDVLGVVDDEVPIPDHGQVDRQVTDVVAFIEILQEGAEGGRAR